MAIFLQKTHTQLTAPTLLTLFRLIASPCVLPIMLVKIAPSPNTTTNFCLVAFFGFLALTDFFDGFLARKLCQESEFGKILDPLADKFLLYSSLIALLAVGRIYYYWVIVLIGREFFVMGLRLLALENGFRLSVSNFGKAKTTAQLLYITILIVPGALLAKPYATLYASLESTLLCITLALSVSSAYSYYRTFTKTMNTKIYEGDFI